MSGNRKPTWAMSGVWAGDRVNEQGPFRCRRRAMMSRSWLIQRQFWVGTARGQREGESTRLSTDNFARTYSLGFALA